MQQILQLRIGIRAQTIPQSTRLGGGLQQLEYFKGVRVS